MFTVFDLIYLLYNKFFIFYPRDEGTIKSALFVRPLQPICVF